MTSARRVALVVVLLATARTTPVLAQSQWLNGYVQTVGIGTTATPVTDSNQSSFNRFRLTSEPVWNTISVEAAYEHAATIRRRESLPGIGIGAVPGGGEWMTLQWTLAEEEHLVWQHRFDRLQVGWRPTGAVELSAGRQAVSWGTTLFLNPADPFIPFNPADPFREFRAGVDAARLRVYPSPLSEIDVVVRPTTTAVGTELTALARGLTTIGNWELSGWGGSLYGDTAGAFGAAGSLGRWAVRGEGVVRGIDDAVVFRGTIGIDRQLQILRRDLYVVLEYQHDRLAAADAAEYLKLLQSDPFRRGELQVLGRHESVLQVSYQVHPLWSVGGLWLVNMIDGSSLVSPSVAYSAGNDASISGALFLGLGDSEPTLARPLPSEYGLSGTTAFVSVSWYF